MKEGNSRIYNRSQFFLMYLEAYCQDDENRGEFISIEISLLQLMSLDRKFAEISINAEEHKFMLLLIKIFIIFY